MPNLIADALVEIDRTGIINYGAITGAQKGEIDRGEVVELQFGAIRSGVIDCDAEG